MNLKSMKFFLKSIVQKTALTVSVLSARLQMFLDWLESQVFPVKNWQSSPYRSEESALDHWAQEIASLRAEILLIFNSLLWIFGILSLAGFAPSSSLLDIIVSQFSHLSLEIWNSALAFLKVKFSPIQASVISINTISISVFLRAVAISKRGNSLGRPDSMTNFGGYLYFFSVWLIILYSVYNAYVAFSIYVDHPDVVVLDLWRRVASTVGIVALTFIATNIFGWALFFIFYILVVRYGPARYTITLASRRPYLFAAVSFASIPVIFAGFAWFKVVYPSAIGSVITGVISIVIVSLAYFNILCLIVFSFGVPRIPLALLLASAVVFGLDFLLPDKV